MSTANTVLLYQNGIAEFVRNYPIKGGEAFPLSLPFKKDHIGDVAATLSILGDGVTVKERTWSTKKDKPALEIDPSKATYDLFTKLTGSEIALTLNGVNGETIKGRVCGFQTENNLLKDAQITQHWLSIQKEDGSICRYNLNNDVNCYTFTDQKVQDLIRQALDYNIQKINPDSNYFNAVMTATKDTQATVKYTVPNPAFKLSYRIKQLPRNTWLLQGYAIVDNDTDEDWKDFMVRCATGQIVTFETDIAELVKPARQKINLVNRQATGAVEVEGNLEAMGASARGIGLGVRSKNMGAAPMAACFDMNDSAPDAYEPTATAIEVGDSTIFESMEPTTIPAKKSALVKVLEQKLKDAVFCLYYQPAKNPSLLMRCLKTTNETSSTLAKGICSIEQQNMHVGTAILSLCKPGEEAMLCYAAETGCKVLSEVGQEKQSCQSHKLAEGVMVSTFKKTKCTVYTFTNTRQEDFMVYFDYHKTWTGSTMTTENCKELQKLKGSSVRYTCTVPARKDGGNCTVTVTEEYVTYQSIKANEFLEWVHRNPDSPLLKLPNMSKIMEKYKELESCGHALTAATTKMKNLKDEQERLRQNVAALKDSPDANRMRIRLVSSEYEITGLTTKEMPSLETRKINLTNEIRKMVAECTCDWSADGRGIYAGNRN